MMNCKLLNVKIDEYEDKMNEVLNSGKYRRLDVLYCDGKNIVTQIIFDEDDMSEDVLSDSLTKSEIKALDKYIGKPKRVMAGFAKTGCLASGEEESLRIVIEKSHIAQLQSLNGKMHFPYFLHHKSHFQTSSSGSQK